MSIPVHTGPASIPFRQISGLIDPKQFCWNHGALVSATLQNHIANQVNASIRWRTKEFFSSIGDATDISSFLSKTGSTTRWRGAFHTGLYAAQIGIDVIMLVPNGGASNPRVTVDFTGPTSGTITDTIYGTNSTDTAAVENPNSWSYQSHAIDCDPDEPYTFAFTDVDYARTLAVCIYEISHPPLLENGYIDARTGMTGVGPIYSWHREIAAKRLYDLMVAGRRHCFTHGDSAKQSSATAHNILDLTSTTVSSSSPGVTLDLRYMHSLGKSAVSAYFSCFGQNATSAGGEVTLRTSGGTVATLSSFSTAGEWKSVQVDLSTATEVQYDVYIKGDGTHTFNAWGPSLYLYEGANPP